MTVGPRLLVPVPVSDRVPGWSLVSVPVSVIGPLIESAEPGSVRIKESLVAPMIRPWPLPDRSIELLPPVLIIRFELIVSGLLPVEFKGAAPTSIRALIEPLKLPRLVEPVSLTLAPELMVVEKGELLTLPLVPPETCTKSTPFAESYSTA